MKLIFTLFFAYIVFRVFYGGVGFISKKISKSKILQNRKEQAQSIHFSFDPDKTIDELQQFWPAAILESGNVMKGNVDNIQVAIADFTAKNHETRIDDYVCVIFRDANLEIPSFFMFPRGELTVVESRYNYYELIAPPALSENRIYGYNCPKKHQRDAIQSFFKSIQSLHAKRPFRLFCLERPSFSAIGFQNGQLIIVKHTQNPLEDNCKALVAEWLLFVEIFHDIQEEWQNAPSIAEKPEKRIENASSLIDEIANGIESEQIAAREELAAYGAEIVRPLMTELKRAKYELVTHNLEAFTQNVIWVMTEIARNKKNGNRYLWCPRCLANCRLHKETIEMVIPKTGEWEKIHQTFTYYGCRVCHNSRDLFEFKGRMVAVLDKQMIAEKTETGRNLYINWLKRRTVFDFNRVDIIHTDDEQVERFVVQVGNDTDSWRQARYKQMRCRIDTDCHLSQNSFRILKNTFGEVQRIHLN